MEEHHYYGKSGSTSSNNINGRNLNFSNQELFTSTSVGEVPNNKESMDNILDDLLQHTEANNYLHQLSNEIFSPHDERSSEADNNSTQLVAEKSSSSKKRGGSERGDNKDAVRKYREKLKAREVLLEDEIKKLKTANEELTKRLEGEAAMQAEVCWLKCLLVDIKGRIEGETCSFRFYKSFNHGTSFHDRDNHMINHCNGHHGSDGKFTPKRKKFYDQGSDNVGETDKINCITSLGSEPKQFLSFTREI